MKKLISLVVAFLGLFLFVSHTFAATDLGTNWRVFNGMPGTAKFWDINKPDIVDGSYTFPIQRFVSPTAGSFVIYFLNNYNVDMTGKTISAKGLSWTPGEYLTRASCPGAYVRLEFQDVTSGPYDVNDYWWSTGGNSLDLNLTSPGDELSFSLANRDLWTNMAGMSANDNTTTGYVDWNGTVMKDTPYIGFTNATKNVKQVGLSFGSSCTYASGVARVDGSGTFTVSSFMIQ